MDQAAHVTAPKWITTSWQSYFKSRQTQMRTGYNMPKRLSEAQVTSYDANGFLGPIDLLTADEAAEVRRHIEAIEAKLGIKMMSRFRIKAHLPFPFLCDLVSHPRLLDAVEDLIGPNILCWGSSFFQKEPGDKSFVSWHQDSTYYGLEPPNTLTAWIAITEASIASGCMRFLPRSQGKGVYSHDELAEKDNLLSRGQTVKGVDESHAVHVPLKAGQFSFHKEDTLHASHPNSADDRRIGLSIHYVAPDVRETNFPGASAMLLRGKDTHGHWLPEKQPKTDLDSDCLAELDRVFGLYKMAPQRGKRQVDPLRFH
jgi:non-haem Fe2+, alpha-ketoglutarate-dependent halogenase